MIHLGASSYYLSSGLNIIDDLKIGLFIFIGTLGIGMRKKLKRYLPKIYMIFFPDEIDFIDDFIRELFSTKPTMEKRKFV